MKPADTLPAGYLTRLIERVVPGAPVLQRRQPALFETQTAWGEVSASWEAQSAAEAAYDGAAAASLPAVAVADALPALVAAAPLPAAALGIAQQLGTPVMHAPADEPGPQPSLRAEPLAPRRALKVDGTVRMNAAPAPRGAAPGATPPPVAAADSTVGGAKGIATAVALPPYRPATEVLAASRRPGADTGNPPPPAREPTTRPTVAGAASRSRPAVPAEAQRFQQRASALRAAVHATAPAPAREPAPVQVTIGRVEVRAVTAAAPAERSKRAPPRLSLDQYLRERGGGGR